MANDALPTNPDYASQLGITTHGSDWLWAAFAVMLLSDLVVLAWHFTIPRGQRIFHQLALIVLTTAAIAYFSMASNLGSTPVATEFAYLGYPVGTLRQIWYVRYIDWVITTPSLLLSLVMASGLPLSDIITLIFFDVVMIVVGLVGALVSSSYKWGYFTFGMFAEFYIWWVLAGPARVSAGAIGPEYKSAFTKSAIILSFLWLLYPVAWGLADGGSVIYPDSEMIFYGILDVLAKPVFIFIHLFALSKLDLTALQLSSGKYTDSAAGVALHDQEKHPRTRAAGPVANTAVPAKTGGLFAKRGRHDASMTGVTVHENPPRTSEATVVR